MVVNSEVMVLELQILLMLNQYHLNSVSSENCNNKKYLNLNFINNSKLLMVTIQFYTSK